MKEQTALLLVVGAVAFILGAANARRKAQAQAAQATAEQVDPMAWLIGWNGA